MALDDAGKARSCRVVVLREREQAFCGGLDLAHLQEMGEQAGGGVGGGCASGWRGCFGRCMNCRSRRLRWCRVRRLRVGRGWRRSAILTLAAQGAKFGYTEVRIGFVPALVSAYLVLQMGDKRARELLVTGRLFDGGGGAAAGAGE